MGKNWITNTLNKVNKVKTKRKDRVKLKVTKAPERDTIQVQGLKPIPKMELAIKPNYERLIMLLDMRTYSYEPLQDKFISKLQDHFTSLGAVAQKDAYGNLYVTKGNAEVYPCVVAHTDINQRVRANVKIMTAYPWMFGFDVNKGEQAGMGADDKVQERSATEQGEPGPVQGRATHILEQPARRQPSQGNHQLLEKRHGQADLRGLPVVQGGHVRDGRCEWDSGAAEYRQPCRAQET